MAPHPLPRKSKANTSFLLDVAACPSFEKGGALIMNMNKITTRMLTRMALLIALNIILTRVLSVRIPLGGVEGLRIGFGSLPVIFAGIFFGPTAGGIVGAIGDLIGYFINPVGAYMPHFTIAAALRGVLPGLVILLLSRGRRQIGIFPLFLAVCGTLFLTDIFLVPYFLETLFGLSRLVTIPTRLIQNAIAIPAYTILLFSLGRAMEKVFPFGSHEDALHLTGKLW